MAHALGALVLEQRGAAQNARPDLHLQPGLEAVVVGGDQRDARDCRSRFDHLRGSTGERQIETPSDMVHGHGVGCSRRSGVYRRGAPRRRRTLQRLAGISAPVVDLDQIPARAKRATQRAAVLDLRIV